MNTQSVFASAIFANSGAILWHGPHHVAVKSTTTSCESEHRSAVVYKNVRRRQRHRRRAWSATGPQWAPPTHAQMFHDGAPTRAHDVSRELNVRVADTTRHAAQCTLPPAPARTASNSALVGICLTMVPGSCRLPAPLQVRGSCWTSC